MNTKTIDEAIAEIKTNGEKQRLLLHVCCAPCLCGVIDRILPYFDISLFFYNPNIYPKEEFIKRLDALKAMLLHFNDVKLIVPEQTEEEYSAVVTGLEKEREGGSRCTECFKLRLDKTAKYLSLNKNEFDCFATTLTVSPHKNAPLINRIGEDLADRYGIRYLCSDFKKQDGFLHSIQLSKELNLYRQNYCGCKFSVWDTTSTNS